MTRDSPHPTCSPSAAKRMIYYEHHGRVARRHLLPQDEERVTVIREHIPHDVDTILDVGCGVGLVSRFLSATHRVVGVDISKDVHKGASEPRVCGHATCLPFQSGSMDLVLATQIFEHLTDADLATVASEMVRVSRRYVLVTTTFRENLQEAAVPCPACGAVFNAYGHLRTFDGSSLAAAVPGCSVLESRTYAPVRAYPAWLVRLNQNVLGFWHSELALVCTECGHRAFPSGRTGMAHLSRLSNAAAYLLARRRPSRILTLLEKR